MDNILQYVDKLFFYCLKKCKDRNDAEELSSQVILEVLIAINNNRKINDLESYIFSIANNQYNKLIKKKVNIREHEVNLEKTIIESYASDETIKEKIFEDETYNNIKTQIQTLSSEYLYILYGYYVEDKTLQTISNEMRIPLGTVKRKLYELRNKLTEAVKMERLNGKKAYIPEQYYFGSSGLQMYNLRQHVSTLLSKNLLVHAYDNPCTLEDFALELGVSMPYIEDIVNDLKEIEFLKEISKGKYVSTLPLITRKFLNAITENFILNSKSYLEELHKFCKKHFEEYKEIVNCEIDDKLLMWSLMFYVNQVCEHRVALPFEYSFKKYGNKAEYIVNEDGPWNYKNRLAWCFSHNVRNDLMTNLNCWAWPCSHSFIEGIDEEQYKPMFYHNSLQGHDVDFNMLSEASRLINKNIDELNSKQKMAIEQLVKQNVVKLQDNKIKLNIAYLNQENYRKLIDKIDDSEDLNKVTNELNKIYLKIKKMVEEHLPDYLHSKVNYVAMCSLSQVKSFVVDYFLDQEELAIPSQGRFVYSAIFWERDRSKPWNK